LTGQGELVRNDSLEMALFALMSGGKLFMELFLDILFSFYQSILATSIYLTDPVCK
jgi:hypothetical protein